MMKRTNNRLMLTVALLLLTLTASARFNGAKKDAPNAYLGLRAGIGASMYSNVDDPVAIGTPIGGVAIGVKVAKVPLYLELGALYMNMGSKVEEWYDYHRHWDDPHTGRGSRRNNSYTYTINNHSVMVPLVATYHLYANDNITIRPFTGFYGSYGFDSEKTDFGLREGVGFSFGFLYVDLGVNIGVIGQDRDEENYWLEDGHHASAFLSVGINF